MFNPPKCKSILLSSSVLALLLLLLHSTLAYAQLPGEYLQPTHYLDYEHPLVRETLDRVVKDAATLEEKAEHIFYFVRDNIAFGWTPSIYEMKASDVLMKRVGFSNTKGTLFTAMLRSSGIPARQRFYRIQDDVIKGFISRPNNHLDYSYTEFLLNGKWIKTDAYTVDLPLYLRARQRLAQEGKNHGYGILRLGSVEWSPTEDRFIQFYGHHSPLVKDHHGVFADVEDFYVKRRGNDRIPKYAPKLIIRSYIARVQKRVRHVRQDF